VAGNSKNDILKELSEMLFSTRTHKSQPDHNNSNKVVYRIPFWGRKGNQFIAFACIATIDHPSIELVASYCDQVRNTKGGSMQ
jgi:hypothetical protein